MNNTTNTRADALDRAAAFADRAQKEALLCGSFLRLPDSHQTEEYKRLAQEKAKNAATAAGDALGVLVDAGAVLHALPPAESVPLHLLDTPGNRALLAVLDAAVLAAEKVDAERGRVMIPVDASDTAGTDLAESLSQLRARVYMEVHGASGRE